MMAPLFRRTTEATPGQKAGGQGTESPALRQYISPIDSPAKKPGNFFRRLPRTTIRGRFGSFPPGKEQEKRGCVEDVSKMCRRCIETDPLFSTHLRYIYGGSSTHLPLNPGLPGNEPVGNPDQVHGLITCLSAGCMACWPLGRPPPAQEPALTPRDDARDLPSLRSSTGRPARRSGCSEAVSGGIVIP